MEPWEPPNSEGPSGKTISHNNLKIVFISGTVLHLCAGRNGRVCSFDSGLALGWAHHHTRKLPLGMFWRKQSGLLIPSTLCPCVVTASEMCGRSLRRRLLWGLPRWPAEEGGEAELQDFFFLVSLFNGTPILPKRITGRQNVVIPTWICGSLF